MTTEIASIIVVALFGLLIGVLLQVAMKVLEPLRKKEAGLAAPPSPAGGKDKTRIGRFLEEARQRAELSTTHMAAAPRSHKLVILSFYLLVGMLIIVIKLSPVQMNGWILVGGVFAGFQLAQLVFWLAQKNRIRLTPRTRAR